MKTKFVLHGGLHTSKHEHPRIKKFFRMMIDAEEKPVILGVPFAKEDETYEERHKEDLDNLNRVADRKMFVFIQAKEKNFSEQLKEANVIYLRGGNTEKLLNTLKRCADFSELIKGKTVFGSSAGVYVLSKYFYSKSMGRDVFEGLGILPIKSVTHWDGTDVPIDALKKAPGDFQIVALKEPDIQVVELDL